jgi:hypothetical protein
VGSPGGDEILDTRRITTRATVGRHHATDVRWIALGAGLGLALLAGVMLEMVLDDHSRASLVWMTALAAVLAGAVGSVVMIGVRDAAVLWETRKSAAIAEGDAEIAERRADLCTSNDLRSRELLERLQVATVDALRDPFLADRLARGPRDERRLLVLLDQIDQHLRSAPGDAAGRPQGTAPRAGAHRKRKPNPRNP